MIDESNFYCVFRASGGVTFGIYNGEYCYICCCFVGFLKMKCILRKKSWNVRISCGKEEALNDMIINWSLSLVKEIVDKLWKWSALFVRLST